MEQSTNFCFAVLGSFLQFPVEIVVLLDHESRERIADRFKFKQSSSYFFRRKYPEVNILSESADLSRSAGQK